MLWKPRKYFRQPKINLPSNSKFPSNIARNQGCIANFGPQIHIAKASGRKLIQTHIDAALDVLWSESGKTISFFFLPNGRLSIVTYFSHILRAGIMIICN